MSFVRAFYGDGRDIDKATSSWAVSDYWYAMGQQEMARCFEQIADFYYSRHKVKMEEYKKKLLT
jgi:hypothetical protein